MLKNTRSRYCDKFSKEERSTISGCWRFMLPEGRGNALGSVKGQDDLGTALVSVAERVRQQTTKVH